MPAITYTALRNMVKNTFVISAATDISAAAADNSFNSSTTDLSGLLAGQWILVTGGVNAGWHKVSADSTTAKITTLSSLTDEAAGTAIDMQGYMRGYGQTYSFDLPASVMDKSSKERKSINTPINGQSEVLLHNIKKSWSIVTGRQDKDADIPQLQEFLDSVAAGEVFVFDAYGTVATPDDPRNVQRLDDGYGFSRVGMRNKFTIAFSVTEI